jgi:hypothetical protein
MRVAFALYDNAGAPLTGAHPTFATYVSKAGVARPTPSIFELGGGLYAFEASADDAVAETAYEIDNGAGASPARSSGIVSLGSFVAFGVYDASDLPLTGAAPSFLAYRDSIGARPAPVLVELGGGLYGFQPSADDLAAEASYLINTGGNPSSVAGTVEGRIASSSSATLPPAASTSASVDGTPAPSVYARDLMLDPTTGDLALVAGDLVLVSGREAIAQSCRMRLRFFAGEWFADLDAGVPYFGAVLVKNPNPDQLRGIFRDVILGTDGVTDVPELGLVYDGTARSLSITFTASTDLGQLGPLNVSIP